MRETQNLNGEWRLILDPADEGLKEKWFQDVPADCLNVTVPSVWDRWAPDYDGVGWYYRTFEMPDHWQDRHVDLRFEAADYEARVWLNGAEIGGHEGGYTPFTLDATQAVRPGGNLMAVRIVDPHGPKGYGDIQPTQIACAKENAYWSYAGIWGDVSLTAKSPAHITDVFIQPDLRRKRVTATIDRSARRMDVSVGGRPAHTSPFSTGRRSDITPVGSDRPTRMHRSAGHGPSRRRNPRAADHVQQQRQGGVESVAEHRRPEPQMVGLHAGAAVDAKVVEGVGVGAGVEVAGTAEDLLVQDRRHRLPVVRLGGGAGGQQQRQPRALHAGDRLAEDG